MKKVFLILDANSILHRAFYALPPLKTKKGELVNAVYGFLLVFFKVIREFKPNFIFACFDCPAPTFRHKEFVEYKAKRPPMPKDLSSQIPKVKEILKAFSVPILEKEGYEADDLIGTISKQFPDDEKIIVSSDSDLFQLIDQNTKFYFLKRGVKSSILYDENLLAKEYGLKPEQIPDFKALIGDSSDNIPGIAGIGEKTAKKLIREFGKLENLYKNSNKTIPPKIKKMLEKYKSQIFLNKALIQIKKDVPLEFNLEKYQRREKEYNRERIIKVLENYQFYSLIKRLPEFEESTKGVKLKEERSEQQKTLF